MLKEKPKALSFQKAFGLLLCPYLFTKKEIHKLIKQVPEVETYQIETIADTLTTLESFQFDDLHETILTYPKLLLVDACTLSEEAQKCLELYHDMGEMRKEILRIYEQ